MYHSKQQSSSDTNIEINNSLKKLNNNNAIEVIKKKVNSPEKHYRWILIDLQTLSYKKTNKPEAPIKESINILFGDSRIYINLLKNDKEYEILNEINLKFKEVKSKIFIFPITELNKKENELLEQPDILNKIEEIGIFKKNKVNLNKIINKNNEIKDIKKLLLNSKENKSSLKMLGLRNLSNTCYMNVALQLLMNCDLFVKLLTKKKMEKYINIYNTMGTKGNITLALKDFFKEYQSIASSKKRGILSPISFLKIFRKYNKFFDNKEEHDSTDFLFDLLGKIDEDLMIINPILFNDIIKFITGNTKKKLEIIKIEKEEQVKELKLKENIISLIDPLFFGKIILNKKCRNCNIKTEKEDRFMNIELNKPKKINYIEAEIYYNKDIYKIFLPIKIIEIKKLIKEEFNLDCIIIKGFEKQKEENILKKKSEENFIERSFSNLSLIEEDKIKICLLTLKPTKDIINLLDLLINYPFLFIRVSYKNIFFITKYLKELLIKNNEFFKSNLIDNNNLESKIFNSTKQFLEKLFKTELKMEMKLILKNQLPLINVFIKNKSIFDYKLKYKKLSIINKLSSFGNLESSFNEFLNYESICICNSIIDVNIHFKYLPLYLIISIKRTEFKDNKVIKTPWNIDIPDILLLKGIKYNLKSLVNHLENLTYSHYTNYCIKEGFIWYCNDSTIKRVKKVDDSNVYYAVFEKDILKQ